jgi:hypothetical protein
MQIFVFDTSCGSERESILHWNVYAHHPIEGSGHEISCGCWIYRGNNGFVGSVTINRTGDKPLSERSVRSIRPGQTFSTQDSRGGGSINTTVTSKTVYLDVTC